MSLTWKSLTRYIVLRRFEHTIGKRIDRAVNKAIDQAIDGAVAKIRGIHAPAAPKWLVDALIETGSESDEAKRIAASIESDYPEATDQAKLGHALRYRREARKALDT